MTLAAALPERSALDRLVSEAGLRLVWVHTDRLSPDAAQGWQTAAGGDGGKVRLVAKRAPTYSSRSGFGDPGKPPRHPEVGAPLPRLKASGSGSG